MTKSFIQEIMENYNHCMAIEQVENLLKGEIDNKSNHKNWINNASLQIKLPLKNDGTLVLKTTLVELIINMGYRYELLIQHFQQIKKEIHWIEKREAEERKRIQAREQEKRANLERGFVLSDKASDPNYTVLLYSGDNGYQQNKKTHYTQGLRTFPSILKSLYLHDGGNDVKILLDYLQKESPKKFRECVIELYKDILEKRDNELAWDLLNKEPGIANPEILSCQELNRPEYDVLYHSILDGFLKNKDSVRSWIDSYMNRSKIHTDEAMGSEHWFEVIKRIAENYQNDPEVMELLAKKLFSIVITQYKDTLGKVNYAGDARLFYDDFKHICHHDALAAKEQVEILQKEENGIQFSETLFGILTTNAVVKRHLGSKLFHYALKYKRVIHGGSENLIKDLVLLGADVNHSKFYIPDPLRRSPLYEQAEINQPVNSLDEKLHYSLLTAILRNPDLRSNETAKQIIAEISNPSGAYGKSIVQACVSSSSDIKKILEINPDYIGEMTLFFTLLPSYDEKYPIDEFTYDIKLIDKLLENKAAANIYQNGRTPLLIAIRTCTNSRNLIDIVNKLLEAGANPFVLSVRGTSCLAYVDRNVNIKNKKRSYDALRVKLTEALDGAEFETGIGWIKDGSVIVSLQEAIGNPDCGRNESKEDAKVLANIPIFQDEDKDVPHPSTQQTAQPKKPQFSRRMLADNSGSSNSSFDDTETIPEPTSPKEPIKLAQGVVEYVLEVDPQQILSHFPSDGSRIRMKDAGQNFIVNPEGNREETDRNTFTLEFTNYLKSKSFIASPARGAARYFTIPKERKQEFINVVKAFDVSEHRFVQIPPSQAPSAPPQTINWQGFSPVSQAPSAPPQTINWQGFSPVSQAPSAPPQTINWQDYPPLSQAPSAPPQTIKPMNLDNGSRTQQWPATIVITKLGDKGEPEYPPVDLINENIQQAAGNLFICLWMQDYLRPGVKNSNESLDLLKKYGQSLTQESIIDFLYQSNKLKTDSRTVRAIRAYNERILQIDLTNTENCGKLDRYAQAFMLKLQNNPTSGGFFSAITKEYKVIKNAYRNFPIFLDEAPRYPERGHYNPFERISN